MRRIALAVFVLAALAVSIAPVSADWSVPRGKPLGYEVQITKRFSHGSSWTGALAITVNEQGIVSGQYKSTSAKPDPFYGKIVNVTGGLSGTNIRLDFNVQGTYQAKGTISEDKIVGTFYDPRMTTYDFVAKRVPLSH